MKNKVSIKVYQIAFKKKIEALINKIKIINKNNKKEMKKKNMILMKSLFDYLLFVYIYKINNSNNK